jgi:hypothetical protein
LAGRKPKDERSNKEGSISFLKKRNKKLFTIALRAQCFSLESADRSYIQKFFVSFFQKRNTSFLSLERLHPDWKIIGIRRAAPASCLQSICISLKPPAHEGRFQSG